VKKKLIVVLLLLTACSEKQPQVAIFGDSIIEQMTPVQPSLAPPFNTALNYGISGQVSGQIADRVRAAAPTVFLEGGTNDLLNPGLGDNIVASYRRMLDKLSGIQVRIIGIPPVDEAALRPDWRPFINNAKVAEINAQLADLCRSYSNCHPIITAMQFNMSGHTLDGIHLRPAGYLVWTSSLASVVAIRGH
jgi:lysophospholipase L1-like esterase